MLHTGGPINESMNQLIKRAEAALAMSRASRSSTGGAKKQTEKVYQKQLPVIGGGSVDHTLQQQANNMVELEGAGPSLKQTTAVKPKAKAVGNGKKKTGKAPAKPKPKAKAKSKGQIMEELIDSLTGQGMIAAGQQSGAGLIAAGQSGAGMIAAGHKKPKRKVNQSDKQKRRNAAVKLIMQQHNLSLPAASKYVKEHNVKY